MRDLHPNQDMPSTPFALEIQKSSHRIFLHFIWRAHGILLLDTPYFTALELFQKKNGGSNNLGTLKMVQLWFCSTSKQMVDTWRKHVTVHVPICLWYMKAGQVEVCVILGLHWRPLPVEDAKLHDFPLRQPSWMLRFKYWALRYGDDLSPVYLRAHNQCFSTGGHEPHWRHLAMSGDIFDCHNWRGKCYRHLEGGVWGCCWTSDNVEESPHNKEVSGPTCRECRGWETKVYTDANLLGEHSLSWQTSKHTNISPPVPRKCSYRERAIMQLFLCMA